MMSKLGDRVLTEKTRVQVTIANFVMLIFSIISAVVFLVNWKADIENRVEGNEENITKIEKNLEENDALIIETQTSLAEIKTDLKWIRAYMENDK